LFSLSNVKEIHAAFLYFTLLLVMREICLLSCVVVHVGGAFFLFCFVFAPSNEPAANPRDPLENEEKSTVV
jgi:hypothetical protein